MVLECNKPKALELVEEIKKELQKNPNKYKAFLVALKADRLHNLIGACSDGEFAYKSRVRKFFGDL